MVTNLLLSTSDSSRKEDKLATRVYAKENEQTSDSETRLRLIQEVWHRAVCSHDGNHDKQWSNYNMI